jgi:hypothetical protein
MQCYENETGARVGAAHKSTRRKPGSKTIAKNQWFVEAQWYRSTSHDPGVKRYKLLDGVVHVPPDAFTYRSMNWSGLMSRRVQTAEGESILIS